jgi:hypothetical protein
MFAMKRFWKSPMLVRNRGRSAVGSACLIAAIGLGAPLSVGAWEDIEAENPRSADRAGEPAALGVTLKDAAEGGVSIAGVIPNSPAADAGLLKKKLGWPGRCRRARRAG